MTSSSLIGQEYAYGYGRIGVLQQQLLGQSDVDRLLGAHNEKELRQILSEIKLTAHVMPLENLEDLVPAMERWLRSEVESMAPKGQEEVFHILWLREDLPVLAYFLKQYHFLTSSLSTEPKLAVTSFDIRRLKALVLEGANENGVLPEDLVQFVQRIKAKTGITAQEIDGEVAQFVAHRQVDIARRSGSKLIQRYVAHLIDLQNIRTARRLTSYERAHTHFTEGGEIPVDVLSSSMDKLELLIRRSSLPNAVADSLMKESDSALALERGLNRGLAHDIAEMRGIPLSIEPVFAFAIIALSHILLVRTILIGKAAHLSGPDISAMLPPFFSTSFANA